MKKAPILANEAERLNELRSMQVLDTSPEIEFDDITKIASQICDVPIALVSLIDSDRQWFKSKVGLEAPETPRDVSFCGHAIHESKVFVIEDSFKDERFKDNPLATAAPHVRFYAGAPLITSSGYGVGTLCVIDSKPRVLTQSQIDSLEALARIIVGYLERRKTGAELIEKANKMKCQAIDVIDNEARFLESTRNSALATFASSVAHEMNNPLAIISGKVESLIHKLDKNLITSEQMKPYLQQMLTATKRATEIIKALQYVSRDAREMGISDVTITSLVSLLRSLLDTTAADAKVALKFDFDPKDKIRANPVHVMQALLNLLTNAIEHCKEVPNAEIHFKAFKQDDVFKIQIQDTGKGIPKDLEETLFLPFVTSKAAGKGPGLGLSIAKKTFEDIGGSLKVVSFRGPTIFEISLPALNQEKKSA